jgi:hypothetical protein
MKLRLMIGVLIMGTTCAFAAPARIYFLHGGRSHGPGDHEFRAGSILLARALNEQSGLPVEAIVHAGWPEDDSILDDAAAVIIYCDHTSVTRHGLDTLDRLAARGCGIMMMHYAVHPSKEIGEKHFTPWIGGYMETGWSVNPHWVADLQPKPGHDVQKGIDGKVKAFDEFYYNMRFRPVCDGCTRHHLVTAVPTRENLVRVINLWTQEGEDGLGSEQTIMWGLERKDGGRGVGFTGGHYHRNWALDDFRTIVLNAICWTARVEVPKGGVKSNPISAEDLNKNLDGTPREPLTVPTLEELNTMKKGTPFKSFAERQKGKNK